MPFPWIRKWNAHRSTHSTLTTGRLSAGKPGRLRPPRGGLYVYFFYFYSFSTKSVSKLLQNLRNNIKFNFKRRTISSFLKFFIVFEGWGTDFSEVSHLYAITIAYRGSKFSKKHRSYSWPIYIARIFGKNFIWLNGVHFTKKGGFLQIFKAQYLRYLEG